MTEAEWMNCTDPTPMLEFLRGKTSLRKLRLLEVAGCRRIWQKFRSNRSRRAVEVAERYADGLATAEELRAGRDEALQWHDLIVEQDFEGVAYARVAVDVALVHLPPLRLGTPDVLRDIFGNPFRPIVLNPQWVTPKVVALAQAIYEERAFERLPIFADALEETGGHDADIIGHCRKPGPHVRGCWVVDLSLGKG